MMSWLKTLDADFIRKNFKDQAMAESIIKGEASRNRLLAVVMIGFLLVVATAVGYAALKVSDRKYAEVEVERVTGLIDLCVEQANEDMLSAANDRKSLEVRHREIQQQLEACLKTKRK